MKGSKQMVSQSNFSPHPKNLWMRHWWKISSLPARRNQNFKMEIQKYNSTFWDIMYVRILMQGEKWPLFNRMASQKMKFFDWDFHEKNDPMVTVESEFEYQSVSKKIKKNYFQITFGPLRFYCRQLSGMFLNWSTFHNMRKKVDNLFSKNEAVITKKN